MTSRVVANFGSQERSTDESIRVTGPGIAVTANAKFDAAGDLAQLQAPIVRIGQSERFLADPDARRLRAWTSSCAAIRSTARAWAGTAATAAATRDFDEPFHINARLDRLVLREGVAVSSFALDVTGIADRPAAMSLTGSLSKTATRVGLHHSDGDGPPRASSPPATWACSARACSASTACAAASSSSRRRCPARRPTAPQDRNAPDFQGKAVLKDFRVVDQPFLARLFTAGSLGGLANLMQGQGIAVDALEVPFSSRNGVISVHDVRATGPAIGITADGYIDRPKNHIALKGSLVPLFGLNSVLGNIPLLGDVLTSKQGEGIFGMTYSVTGNADEPIGQRQSACRCWRREFCAAFSKARCRTPPRRRPTRKARQAPPARRRCARAPSRRSHAEDA